MFTSDLMGLMEHPDASPKWWLADTGPEGVDLCKSQESTESSQPLDLLSEIHTWDQWSCG